jgi:hypothetical protein
VRPDDDKLGHDAEADQEEQGRKIMVVHASVRCKIDGDREE